MNRFTVLRYAPLLLIVLITPTLFANGVLTDPLAAYVRECEKGDGYCCGSLARAYLYGEGPAGNIADTAMAKAYAQKACSLGLSAWCDFEAAVTRKQEVEYERSMIAAASQNDGYHKVIWPNGEIYEGNWQDHQYHGKGTQILHNWSFVGTWKKGKKHGDFVVTNKSEDFQVKVKYVNDIPSNTGSCKEGNMDWTPCTLNASTNSWTWDKPETRSKQKTEAWNYPADMRQIRVEIRALGSRQFECDGVRIRLTAGEWHYNSTNTYAVVLEASAGPHENYIVFDPGSTIPIRWSKKGDPVCSDTAPLVKQACNLNDDNSDCTGLRNRPDPQTLVLPPFNPPKSTLTPEQRLDVIISAGCPGYQIVSVDLSKDIKLHCVPPEKMRTWGKYWITNEFPED